MIKIKTQLRGCIFLLLAALFWGSAFVAQKTASAYPFATNAFRFLLGSVILLPITLIVRRARIKKGAIDFSALRVEDKKSVVGGIISGITLTLATTFQQLGMSMGTTAGKSGFLTALYIIFIPLILLFFGKKAKLNVWISVFIAFIGAFLMSFTKGEKLIIGDILTIICAVCFAVNVICVSKFSSRTEPILFSLMQCFSAGVLGLIVFLISLAFGQTFSVAALKHIALPVVYIAVFSCTIAYTFQVLGQRDTPPAPASIIMSLESVFAVIFGVIILGEKLTLLSFFGIVLIFTATLLSQIEFKKKPKRTDSEEEKSCAKKES